MTTITVQLTFYIPHATSLKDKRQVAQSIIQKAQHKFNAAIAEVDTQDSWHTLTIGVAVVSGDGGHAQKMIEEIIHYMEMHADGEMMDVAYS